jgi:hypothetical protein
MGQILQDGTKLQMNPVFKPPEWPHPQDIFDFAASTFLAGTIEMGSAIDWQEEVTKALADLPVAVLNPRRDNWDSSWKQSIDNPDFKNQVSWELNHLRLSDVAFFYFVEESASPITLMELGMAAALRCDSPESIVICCPPGFWRKGNVDIIAEHFSLDPVLGTLDEAVSELRTKLERMSAWTKK